jgi:hypothetical protein
VLALPAYTADRGGLVVRVVDDRDGNPILDDLTASLVASDEMIGGFGLFAGPGLLVFHSVPAGTYSLLVESRRHQRTVTPGVKIGGPAAPAELKVRLRPGARLAGRVTWAGELPAGAIHVVAKPEAPGAVAIDRLCSRDGSFDLAGLASGNWRITARLQEVGRAPTMTSRPVDLVLEAGQAAPPLDLRLLPIAEFTLRLNGAFAEGEAPTMDKSSAKYGDTLRKLEEFRIRCRDSSDFAWLNATVSELAFGVEDRDLLVRLPLPEGAYVIAVEHDDEDLGVLRIINPGTAELVVPPR